MKYGKNMYKKTNNPQCFPASGSMCFFLIVLPAAFPFATLPVLTVERCKVVHEVLSLWRKSCNVTIHMKPL